MKYHRYTYAAIRHSITNYSPNDEMHARVSEMAGRSSGSTPSSIGISRGKRSSKSNAVVGFTLISFLCLGINVKLHSKAVAGSGSGGVTRENGEPIHDNNVDDHNAYYHRVTSTADARNDRGANVPTWSPTTWSPTWISTSWTPTTAQNQTSWAPTPTRWTSTQTPTDARPTTSKNKISRRSERSTTHPRVACTVPYDAGDDDDHERIRARGSSCESIIGGNFRAKKVRAMPSIPRESKPSYGAEPDDPDDPNIYVETETCKHSDLASAPAPPTCNDVHSFGFDPGMFPSARTSSLRAPVEYVTMGGAKCIWKVFPSNDDTVVLKSNKISRHLKLHFWDLSRKDALISGGVGNAGLVAAVRSRNDGPRPEDLAEWNHVLPMYQYCGLANVVPLADGNLEEYMKGGDDETRKLSPVDTLRVALQAARGLHQAQLYRGGRPTFVHADLNPSQFLVFLPKNSRDDGEGAGAGRNPLPILQINDFNQGRFLTRSTETRETCPFRTCTKNHRGNRYHTPERFADCVDQNEAIDTYSLGSVFFFLLTNGLDPHRDVKNYMRKIKEGALPLVPAGLDLDHPAYDALKEVIKKCYAFELRDRPSSLEVVRMLEARLERIETL